MFGLDTFGPDVSHDEFVVEPAHVNFLRTSAADPLHTQMQQMYRQNFGDSLEALEPTLSMEDKRAVRMISQSVKLVDGHYELRLPRKSECVVLPYNRSLAEKRLLYLKGKLKKDPDLFCNYKNKIDSYVENGYARKMPDEDLPVTSITWYIPHHVVGPKFRIVFDCAASYHGTSLLTGPDNTNSLLGVLLRFRQHLVGIVGDIRGMFHQVRVPPDDCHALRFLWWPNHNLDAEPVDFQMLVHIFGAASSTSVAGFALRQVAIEYKAGVSQHVISTVLENFYADDCLQSADVPSEVIELVAQLKLLLSQGGFKLTKFLSNSMEVLNSIPEEDKAPSLMNLDRLPVDRTLEVFWNTASDNFEFHVKLKATPCTRQGILSMISQIFDPMGFVQPFVLPMKRLLQDLCSQNLAWDCPVPEEKQKKWNEWLRCLSDLETVVVSRCFKSQAEYKMVELHCFSDASTVGYGTCAYLRFVYPDDSIHCSFVVGKSRVALLKAVTIPRLELTAAKVAVKLRHRILHELQYHV